MASKVTSAPKKATKMKEIVQEEVKKEPVKKTFGQYDYIMCRSVTNGPLWYEGPKSHNVYNWVDYGDENEVEYRDLAASVRGRSSFVYNPWFIVEDEDFIAEFPQLQKFYNEQYTVDDLKGVLNLNIADMVATIKTLPKNAVNTLKTIASTEISEGRIDSVRKIKALDEVFDTELHLLSSLAD